MTVFEHQHIVSNSDKEAKKQKLFHSPSTSDIEAETTQEEYAQENHQEFLAPSAADKKKIRFSPEEDKVIEEGIGRFGQDWAQIQQWGNLSRTPKQIKARYERLLLQSAKKNSEDLNGGEDFKRLKSSANTTPNKTTVVPITSGGFKRIDDYFKPINSSNLNNNNSAGTNNGAQVKDLNNQISVLQEKLKSKSGEVETLERMNSELNTRLTQTTLKNDLYKFELVENLRHVASFREKQEKEFLMKELLRLGTQKESNFMNYHHSSNDYGVQREGFAFEEYRKRIRCLNEEKEEWEAKKKLLKKAEEKEELEEELKFRQNHWKKEEAELLNLFEKLVQERDALGRNLNRIRNEETSKYRNRPLLSDRYLLLRLLGKGGFSEVYKGYDVVELRKVACKIQSLNPSWSTQRKSNFIRHALREFHIHRSLDHPRIVKFYDIFELDENTFCIVLEFGEGGDLEQYVRLQPNRCLPEKEAKNIIVQVLSGLKYMNMVSQPIIHYDLKPANILITKSGIKLSDFGLSKIIDQDELSQNESTGVELTFQGAGTYWYLPPECFLQGPNPPKISSKVDVWSVGVIFYQLLFGIKPFGNDQSQSLILKENTIGKAYSVTFPSKPNVSQEAKDFICKCLEYHKEARPDVLTICEDGFLKKNK